MSVREESERWRDVCALCDEIREVEWWGGRTLCDECVARLPTHKLAEPEDEPGVSSVSGPIGDDTATPFTVLDTARMLSTIPPPVDWLIEGVVERGTLTLFAGREKEGKSLLCQALAACMASGGGDVAGIRCKAGRVLMVDAENGERVLHRRVQGLGLDHEAVGSFAAAEARGADLRRHMGHLADLLAEHRPDLLVLDSFRSLWGGDENSSQDVHAVLDPLRNLVREHHAGALLIHHASRAGDYRGSTGIGAAVENVLTLTREREDPDPKRRRLRNPACRYAAERPDLWLRIEGDEARNLVLVDSTDPPAVEAEAQRPTPVQNQLVERVRSVLTVQPQTQADIARALGREPKDQSVRRVLKALAKSGEAEKVAAGWKGCQVSAPLKGGDTVTPPEWQPGKPVATGDPGVSRLGDTLAQAELIEGVSPSVVTPADTHDTPACPSCGGQLVGIAGALVCFGCDHTTNAKGDD